MKLSINKILTVFLAVCCLGLCVACHDDEDRTVRVDEGVIFTLTRKMVYTTGVNEIGSIKITLSDGQKKFYLPSLALKGDEEVITSAPCALAAGDYRVVAYTAYNTRHEFLFDAELDSKNEFKVTPHEVVEFRLPIKTREIMSVNFLRNAMMGICLEVFGDDDSLWPWDPKKYPFPDWEGLEFELDSYGSPMYLSGITFMGMKDGKETPWAKMTAIPDGTLSNIAELATINIVDIPAFKQLPSDLDRLPNLQQISCINTGVEHLPENIFQSKSLAGIILIDSQVKKFNYDLSSLENLHLLVLSGNQLEKFDTPLQGLQKLVSLDLSNNPLKVLDEACFSGNTGLAALTLENTDLSTLPASLAKETKLRRIDLSGSQFAQVPAVLNELPALKTILLDHNHLTTINREDIQNVSALECLSLAGNSIESLPVLANKQLAWLDLTNCGMQTAPDISAYEELRVLLMGENEMTTLPENYFTSIPKMRILNLSRSEKLVSLPDDLGLQPVLPDGKEGFRLLEVQDCPNLNWVTPVSWRCYDFNHDNNWVFSNDDSAPSATFDEVWSSEDDWGRVGVRREHSPFVQFGN